MGARRPRPTSTGSWTASRQHAVEMGGLVEELLLLARLDETAPPDRVEVDLTVVAAEILPATWRSPPPTGT